MDNELHDKVMLVTGGARRVGAAIARRLHAAGARVVLHYRASAAEAERLSQELNDLRRGSAAVVRAELIDMQAVRNLVPQAIAAFGRLDGLINNASSFYPTPVGSIDESCWDDLVGTNLKAPLFLCQAAAGELRKTRGAIVNITDVHADFPMKDHVVYNVAKAGLAALTRALARDLGPDVRVNGVAPGAIMWPEQGDWSNPDTQDRIVQRTALKRIGAPEDIAKAVEYLLTTGTYVTGQILAVDGGRSIMMGET